MELEQQAHLLVMQAFNIQNSKDSMKIAQKSHLVAQMELEQQDRQFPMQACGLQNTKDSTKTLKNLTLLLGGSTTNPPVSYASLRLAKQQEFDENQSEFPPSCSGGLEQQALLLVIKSFDFKTARI